GPRDGRIGETRGHRERIERVMLRGILCCDRGRDAALRMPARPAAERAARQHDALLEPERSRQSGDAGTDDDGACLPNLRDLLCRIDHRRRSGPYASALASPPIYTRTASIRSTALRARAAMSGSTSTTC